MSSKRSAAAIHKEICQNKAKDQTAQAQKLLDSYKQILTSSLTVIHRLEWDTLCNHDAYSVPVPVLAAIYQEVRVPREYKLDEFLFPANKAKRIQKEAEARALYEKRLKDHGIAKQEFTQAQEEFNRGIEQERTNFEAGHGDAIERYLRIVLERSEYPVSIEKQSELQFDPVSATVVVSFELPSKDALPNVIGYKYVATRDETVPVQMKNKEFAIYYEDCLYQICLRTIHEIFDSDYTGAVKSVVFNGWVDGTDPKTGRDFHACIISCMAARKEFETYNLSRVSPRECFKSLKGISAGPLADLAPVRPVMDLNRADPRFVGARDVLTNLDSATNLATMDWEEFEHLVRQLFEEIFKGYGGEVKVTRASRDGGVDAIAFDPDPIRGGKFIIQAKRYNIVVPVSATRDLYGTMISEGATKGILVTTSYYGNDSREFVKDKPISLIDGSNLVYLLQEYGHNVIIELQSKER